MASVLVYTSDSAPHVCASICAGCGDAVCQCPNPSEWDSINLCDEHGLWSK